MWLYSRFFGQYNEPPSLLYVTEFLFLPLTVHISLFYVTRFDLGPHHRVYISSLCYWF
jgi:hypothetical protein